MKKKLFYFSILFLLTNCGHKQIKFSKDGYKCVLYYKNNPYTGLFIKYFDGKIRYISHLIDSVKTGSTIQYNENGTIQAYKEYSKAIKNGLFINFDLNGKISKLSRYNMGKISGPEIIFYKSGQIKKISYSEWFPSRSSYIYTNYYCFKENGNLDLDQSFFYKTYLIKMDNNYIARLQIFPQKENVFFKTIETKNIQLTNLDTIYKFNQNGICNVGIKPKEAIDSCELKGIIVRKENIDSLKGYFERTILMNFKFKL